MGLFNLSADQTHLRRYLTTLGVSVAAGTLSLAGLFLKLQQDMLVTKSTLAELTPLARADLLERQRYLDIATTALPYFTLIGFIGGLFLASFGLIGWARRQKVADELEDVALSKGQAELRQMTAQEQEEKLDREAAASAAGTSRANVADIRDRARILEVSLGDRLQTALGKENVETNVIASPAAGLKVGLDGLVRYGGRAIVLELKYVQNKVNARKRLLDGTMQVERAVRAVQATGVLEVDGVLILVTDDGIDDSFIGDLTGRGYERRRDTLFGEVRIVVRRYSEFLALSPADLAASLLGDAS